MYRRLAGGSVCICSFGELLHQTVLTGDPLNMQKRGGCMGADGMWRDLLREMDRDGL